MRSRAPSVSDFVLVSALDVERRQGDASVVHGVRPLKHRVPWEPNIDSSKSKALPQPLQSTVHQHRCYLYPKE